MGKKQNGIRTPEELAGDVAAVMIAMQVTFAPIVEGLAGYKAQLTAQGFGNDAADLMLVDYHRAILGMLMKNS